MLPCGEFEFSGQSVQASLPAVGLNLPLSQGKQRCVVKKVCDVGHLNYTRLSFLGLRIGIRILGIVSSVITRTTRGRPTLSSPPSSLQPPPSMCQMAAAIALALDFDGVIAENLAKMGCDWV